MKIVHSQLETKTVILNQSTNKTTFNNQFLQPKKAPAFIKTSESYWIQNAKIEFNPMQRGQLVFKRMMDIIFSFVSLICLFPALIFIAIRTKISSAGPVFYFQERVGKNGKLFQLIKFRSMVLNAEKHFPKLSNKTDNRITTWGKTMRHWRLDELPQLWNIVKGDMSFVGPRPERDYFSKQLVAIFPNYKMLQQLKPGLSSLGMVRFGYAENIEEMLERSRYDFIYLKKPSIVFDLKIIAQTLKVIFLSKNELSH